MLTRQQEIERSIIKKFRRSIWSRFTRGVKEYAMIREGDKIAVCLSGGKDSMLLAKCMQELQKHSDVPFGLAFLVMDPGYAPKNRALIEKNAAELGVPVHIFSSDIFEAVTHIEDSPCYLCARMRRGYLYRNAQALGCNKIALGHHFDDVIETILMSMLYAGEIRTIIPKLHSTNFPGRELIRPLYLVKEADILAWKRYNGLEFLQCACRFTEHTATDIGASKRLEMKALIRKFRETNPQIESNIFRSVENVNLEKVISYCLGGETHSFMDDYDRE